MHALVGSDIDRAQYDAWGKAVDDDPTVLSPLCYIAGPMRGLPDFNFPAFDEAARFLRSCGWTVCSPADMDREYGEPESADGSGAKPLAYYMERDLPAVCRSKAVFLLPGWTKSEGACLEADVAGSLGIPLIEWETGNSIEPIVIDYVRSGGSLVTVYDPESEPLAARVEEETIRRFDTGATRDTDDGKLDFEGFLSPLVIEAFAEYMHANRKQKDGSVRDSDNWQKGIPYDAYMKSLWRHFFHVWEAHRNGGDEHIVLRDLMACLFNVQGYAHELLKEMTCRSA